MQVGNSNSFFILCILPILLFSFQTPSVSEEHINTLLSTRSLTVEERGARHGQALAAARFCPGARLSDEAEKLQITLNKSERVVFNENSQKVKASWEKAFQCTDVDPAQTREINGCRRAKIISCTMTWQEIGPEGTALPGLLEFKP